MGTYVHISTCMLRVPYDKCNNCVSDTQVYCTATAVNATFKPSLSFIITITKSTLLISIQEKLSPYTVPNTYMSVRLLTVISYPRLNSITHTHTNTRTYMHTHTPTQVSKLKMYVLATRLPTSGCRPPNITPLFLSTLVNVNPSHGGGHCPVV